MQGIYKILILASLKNNPNEKATSETTLDLERTGRVGEAAAY